MSAAEPHPPLIAVYFRADWCGNCRVLEPVYHSAQGLLQASSVEVEFLTLDLTASADAYDAAMFSMLDHRMGDIYNRYLGITGIVFIAASDSGELLDCITRRDSATVMLARFERALERVQAEQSGVRHDPVGASCPPALRALPGE
ncbi:thioredoxin domain-containing protein [Maricaulis sp.]|uniref:thioredoxin domain-containing protein n=1 Tax=Maricaulis sp. TaxID=1486257 RepID=UPI002B26A1D2|nr:thioredoxin domain-containing protein [Maricaulis sp.]